MPLDLSIVIIGCRFLSRNSNTYDKGEDHVNLLTIAELYSAQSTQLTAGD